MTDVLMQRGSQGIPEGVSLVRADAERRELVPGQGLPTLAARKSLSWECTLRPYRKPTQVGEARSLRCSSDPWRRNSAK